MLTQQDFVDGGVMYWRVAVIDPDGNVGAFSKAKKFTLLGALAGAALRPAAARAVPAPSSSSRS